MSTGGAFQKFGVKTDYSISKSHHFGVKNDEVFSIKGLGVHGWSVKVVREVLWKIYL